MQHLSNPWLQSIDGGFTLELNHYQRGTPYSAAHFVGEVWITLDSKWRTSTEALREAQALGYRTNLEMKIEGERTSTTRTGYG